MLTAEKSWIRRLSSLGWILSEDDPARTDSLADAALDSRFRFVGRFAAGAGRSLSVITYSACIR